MARSYFGTDGIRGRVNSRVMSPETALRVGLAAGRYFVRGTHRHRVVIGKDTRLSGYMVEAAMQAGFTAAGMDVILTGPIPTPGVAMLTRSMRADLGVMISASHNPYTDNGIKLFGPDGYKLSDEAEAEIESMMDGALTDHLADAPDTGRAERLDDETGRYNEFAKRSFPADLTLAGLKIVIDCANGAGYRVAPTVLWELGAEIIPIGVSPNGTNINENCGSTAPGQLCERVIAEGAHLGLALDGDADRLIVADETGALVDGDQLMALIATSWAAAGRLKGGGIVSTVMSNLGLEKYLGGQGLTLARTQVGDRYVVEHMRAHGFNLGGEQSGHIVLTDYATTGDGLIAALQILAELVRTGRTASDLCHLFDPYPQLLRNVSYSGGDPLADDRVQAAIASGENALGDTGRLVIRKSGTEPLIRVMGEGEDRSLVERVVGDICTSVEDAV